MLAGRLRFVVGGDEQVVSAGESVFIPSEVPHSVEALEDSVVLDVFSPVRDDWVAGRRRATCAAELAQPLASSSFLIPRTAWPMRCSFSTSANRTNPSPSAPKPTPG